MGGRMETLHSAIDTIVGSFSAIRLLYTFVLLAVAIVLLSLAWATGREIFATWGSGKIYLAEFMYFLDGAKKPEYGEQIRSETILFYRYQRGLIKAAQRKHDIFVQKAKTEDRRGEVLATELAFDKHGALPDIDLSIQGVNVKSLLSYFVKLVSPSAPEVTATIFKTDNSRRAYVSLPEEKQPADDDNGSEVPSPYIIHGADSDTETAFRIACFLIWSQSSDRNESYGDFCDWARLLRVNFAIEKSNADSIQATTTQPEIEFVTKAFERAWNRRIRYDNVLSTLDGMERKFSNEKITIAEGKTATIGSVADILRYYNLTSGERGPGGNWQAELPSVTDDATKINTAFFSGQFSADCAGSRPKYPGVVRIVFEYSNAEGAKVPAVMSGLLLRDTEVLTYLPRGFPVREHEGIPLTAKVQTVACGAVAKEFVIGEIKPLGGKNDSFMLLKVPDLQAPNPSLELDFEADESAFDEVSFTGFIRHKATTFVRPPKVAIDNDERWISQARKLQTMRRIRKYGEIMLFDSPFSAGMIGSPILSKDGKVIGMLIGGVYVNSHLRLRLARGLPVTALKDQLAAAPKAAPAK